MTASDDGAATIAQGAGCGHCVAQAAKPSEAFSAMVGVAMVFRLFRRLSLGTAWLCPLLSTALAAGPAAPADPATARLVAEAAAIAPGGTLWVDLHLDIAPGWHVYWRNPGDSGLPTQITWSLPAGFSAGDIVWPVPERFVLGNFGNYGYAGAVDLLVPITAPPDVEPGSMVQFVANAAWLACAELCIPGEAKLALTLPVGVMPPLPDPAAAPLFAAARSHLPQPAGFDARFAIAPRELRLILPAAASAGFDARSVGFFPFDADIVDSASEPRLERRTDGLDVVLARASGAAAAPLAALDGLLVLHGAGDAERALVLHADPSASTAASPAVDGAAVLWWQALLLALLGGAVLNLMPCVFPVLSLKLLSLAGAEDHAAQRRHALAYAAGVVLSFALLGGALLALRAGGATIGWGFQLQSPLVVGLLAYLLFAMGLSLSGVADFGAGLAGLGSRFAGRSGLAGAFATGVLAAVVATPCTAPFMGAALGFALLAPVPLALAIFIALGIGLAAPLVAAALIPALARLLPRPGRWMAWFKQLLAFPLYGTVAWLIWVLMQEVGPAGALAALFGLVCVGFAMWIYGCTRLAGPTGRRVGSGLAAAGMAAALAIAVTASPGPEAAAARGSLAYEPFSMARLAGLTAEHRPVFVNLTAAWCLTCLVNEHATLDSAAVQRAFADHHIVALRGDWTRRNPEITGFLRQFGRSGVPLYVLYDAAGQPAVLPQILTEGEVLQAVAKL
jgi:thiol:disulfide interchange protein